MNLVLISSLFLLLFQFKGGLYYVDKILVAFCTVRKGVFSYVGKPTTNEEL